MGYSSINTNVGSLIALQSLNGTLRSANVTQKRVSTGYVVNDSIDNGAAYAAAQTLRYNISGLGAVNQQLGQALGGVSVALEGATNISNTLRAARATIIRLSDNNAASEQRNQYSQDLSRLVSEIQNFRDNAVFNGVNLLTSGANSRSVISDADGDQIRLQSQPLSDTQINNIFVSSGVGDTGNYQSILTQSFVTLESQVLGALTSLGGDYRRVSSQISFNNTLITNNTEGIGIIVDADLSQESTRLISLQVREQLVQRNIGITNNNPRFLLNLIK